MDALEEKLKVIGWDDSYLSRPVNEGFSGGEKKRNEILQLAVLEPKLAILDETDSGLDIDAVKTVAQTVEKLRRPDNATVLVTHYYRILTHIQPDIVHVLSAGRIVKSGACNSERAPASCSWTAGTSAGCRRSRDCRTACMRAVSPRPSRRARAASSRARISPGSRTGATAPSQR